jgi:hypothetical protein
MHQAETCDYLVPEIYFVKINDTNLNIFEKSNAYFPISNSTVFKNINCI